MGKKKWLKGNEKKGENAYFFILLKKNAYYFPNWLKIYKIAQKSLKTYQEGGGGAKKMHLKFKIKKNKGKKKKLNKKKWK